MSKPDSQHSEISIKTSATEAYHWIVENVGPVLPNRDLVDKFMIDELTSLGTKGTIFRNQNIETQYPLAKTWQNINVGTARKDTDGETPTQYGSCAQQHTEERRFAEHFVRAPV